jgi:hypothetical protein
LIVTQGSSLDVPAFSMKLMPVVVSPESNLLQTFSMSSMKMPAHTSHDKPLAANENLPEQ